jgi:Rrf2 family protein
MKGFDARTRYALLAALDLAEHYEGTTPRKVREIAAATGVPPKYLVHILLGLKRKALVNSTRGAKGGYWLLRRPELISAAEVIGGAEPDGREPAPPANDRERAIRELWRQADRRRRGFLAGVTLADLLAGR